MDVTVNQTDWGTLIPIIVSGLLTVIGALGYWLEKLIRATKTGAAATVQATNANTEAVKEGSEQATSVARQTASVLAAATGQVDLGPNGNPEVRRIVAQALAEARRRGEIE